MSVPVVSDLSGGGGVVMVGIPPGVTVTRVCVHWPGIPAKRAGLAVTWLL